MLEILFGSLKYESKDDLIILPLKYIYLFYHLPFLIFVVLLSAKSLGAFGNSSNEEISSVQTVLFRASAIVISFALWIGFLALYSEFK